MRMLVEPLFQPFSLSLTRGFQLFGRTAAIQSLTNAQKLSLPANTPVGTEVMVSDWVAAGLAGPHQRLKAPSTAQGAVLVLLGEQDGVYVPDSALNGRAHFKLWAYGGDGLDIYWNDSGTPQWIIQNADPDSLYYSLSDVATPDLATNWKRVSDDSSAGITVESVTQGELDAGVTISGAVSTPAVNGPWARIAPYVNRVAYRSILSPDYWTFWDDDGWGIQFNNSGSFNPLGGQIYFNNFGTSGMREDFFPTDLAPSHPELGQGWGDPLVFTRNDVASEANWEVIP